MLEPSQSQRYHSRWRDLDPVMPITTLVLFGFGLLAIYSANDRRIDINALAVRQLIYAGVGVALMIAFTVIDYRQLRSLAVPIYLGAVALIVLVMPFGTVIGGAKRWFDLKVMTFQPSEPGKLAMIIALAAFIAWRGPGMRRPLNFLATGVMVAIPTLLIFKEPDLGTSLVYAAIWCGMIAVARTRIIYLLATIFAVIPATYLAWHYPAGNPLIHDYQKGRLLCFLRPEADIQGGCFNVIQARITIGQAGLTGHRFADTGHMDYQLLAVSTTDFAFAHAIGNFGFIGAVALFVLFLILIWRYLRVATLARDEFGQLIAVGATAMLFFQTFVNIGMNEGVLPVTGIPLPFISYGGSPLITLLAIQGVLQSILIHREKLTF